MRKWLAIPAALVLALALAGRADAISRDRANAIALKILRPQAQKGPTILFGLPKPLAKGNVVAEAGSVPPPAKMRTRSTTLRGATWLFWLDQVAYAEFTHPSRVLLVDNRTGKAVWSKALQFYPLVNGKKPSFLTSWKAYGKAATHVYSSLPKSAKALRAPAAPLGRTLPAAVPAGAFKDDCLISLGLRDDPLFSGDFTGVAGWARSVGLRAFKPPNGPGGRAPGGAELAAGVTDLTDRKNCKDVMIFVSGHGYPGPRYVPAIMTGEAAAGQPFIGVTAADLTGIARAHPETTFKLKINGCYSGRFVNELKGERNVLVLETAANASEYSWGPLPTGAIQHPDGRTIDIPAHVNPGRSEFVNGNLAGLTAFFGSATEASTAQEQGGSLLARALARAFDLGSSSDGARLAGLTHPLLHTNLPGFTIKLTGGYRHLGATSEVCGIFGTGQPGATYAATISGPGVIGGSSNAGKTGSLGEGAFSFGINQYGTYTVTVTVTNKAGDKRTETVTVVVTSAQGTCPG